MIGPIIARSYALRRKGMLAIESIGPKSSSPSTRQLVSAPNFEILGSSPRSRGILQGMRYQWMFISTPFSGYHPSGSYPTLFDFVFQPGMRHKRPLPIFVTPNMASPVTDSTGRHLNSALDHKVSVRPEAHLEALFGTLSR